MPRPQSPVSDQEEGNDALLTEELDRLKNEIRTLSNDKKKYEEEIQFKLKTLHDEIRHFDEDNEHLNTELNLAQSDQNKKADEKNLDKLKDLNAKLDKLNAAIDEEKQAIMGLEYDVRKEELKMKKQKATKGNNAAASKDEDNAVVQANTSRRIRVLENQLDKEKKRFCATLTENNELKDEIEKLRNERAIFSDVYNELCDKLRQLRKQKEELTKEATKAYDDRDEANNKCLALKEKNDKDLAQFEIEMKDLQRILDHDKRLRDFMNIKTNERQEWKALEEERRSKHGSTGEVARRQQTRLINTYEEAFRKIRQITNEEDLNVIVREFIKHEDENFALFQFVSEQNNIIETLIEEIEEIKLAIKMFDQEEVGLEEERHKILKEIEVEMKQKQVECTKADTRLTEVNKILEQLRAGVKSLFDKIGCEDSLIVQLLGGDKHITNRNVMLYLGSVEERTNSLLAVEYYRQTKKFVEEHGAEPPDHGMTLGISSYTKQTKDNQIMPPAIGEEFGDDSEASGDEIRPMSQHELYQKVRSDIKKKSDGTPGKAARQSTFKKK